MTSRRDFSWPGTVEQPQVPGLANLTATLQFDQKEAKLEWSEHRMLEFHRLLGLDAKIQWEQYEG